MPLFDWNDKYSVEIVKMDDQHKQLIDLINRLHDAMKNGSAKEVQKGILTDLITYTKTHFKNEEDYLTVNKYPYLSEQQTQHQKFVEQLRQYVQDYKEGKMMLSLDIMNFLKDWLTNHILKVDKKYTTYLKEKGII